MLNIIRERWPLFKKNWASILFVALVQLWWGLNFPAITKLGAPWNIIMGLGMCAFGIWVALYMFLFPEKFASGFKLDHLNTVTYPKAAKAIMRTVQICSFSTVILIAWYKDWYGMSNTYYAILYASSFMMFALMYRSINCYEADLQECKQ